MDSKGSSTLGQDAFSPRRASSGPSPYSVLSTPADEDMNRMSKFDLLSPLFFLSLFLPNLIFALPSGMISQSIDDRSSIQAVPILKDTITNPSINHLPTRVDTRAKMETTRVSRVKSPSMELATALPQLVKPQSTRPSGSPRMEPFQASKRFAGIIRPSSSTSPTVERLRRIYNS